MQEVQPDQVGAEPALQGDDPPHHLLVQRLLQLQPLLFFEENLQRNQEHIKFCSFWT